MAEKVPQSTREKYDHGYYLVGRFMSQWALLEGTLDRGVGKLLGMDDLESAIATTNMQLRSKLHIIKTVINLKRGNSDWGKTATKDIERIGTLADTWRNIVAHVPFGPAEDGSGVRFLTIKAKGKLHFPKTIRTEQDFDAVGVEMNNLTKAVDAIFAKLAKQQGLAGALAAYSSAVSQEQGGGIGQGRPLPALLGFAPPTSEESPQTRQEPEEK
jgi:hypothetical protein